MTAKRPLRCNVGVSPKILTDQHLVAEYRELLVLHTHILNGVNKEIPEDFPLGKGHIRFFRDKQLYLKNRHEALVIEMKKRGYVTNCRFRLVSVGDWKPSIEDTNKIRRRIIQRIAKKPWWYKYKKKARRGPLLRSISVFFLHLQLITETGHCE